MDIASERMEEKEESVQGRIDESWTNLLLFLDSNLPPPKTKKDCLAYLETWFQEKSLIPIQEKQTKTAGNTDLITLGRNMTRCLQLLDNVQDISHVIMENQISTIATRMKTLQGMLAQYYILSESRPHIEFISSANKLKHFVTTSPSKEGGTETKKDNEKYKQHKKDSIEICKKILITNDWKRTDGQSWTLALEVSKKDDLADCFLQGIWYLKQQKLITCAENLKINCVSLVQTIENQNHGSN